jgi:hypothetical protein
MGWIEGQRHKPLPTIMRRLPGTVLRKYGRKTSLMLPTPLPARSLG